MSGKNQLAARSCAVTMLTALTLSGCTQTGLKRDFLAIGEMQATAVDDDPMKFPGPGMALANPLDSGGPRKGLVVTGSGQFTPPKAGTRTRKPDTKEGEYTLSLVSVSVAEASKAVLADIAGVNYIMDPRLEGRVTVQTSKPATRNQIIDLYLGALRTAGAVVVQNGDVYRVTVADQQVSTTQRLGAPNTQANADSLGSGTRILQVKHVSAAEVRRVLEPMAAGGAAIQVDDARNTLMLTGTPTEVAAMEEVVSLFDIDLMKGMSFALVPVSADPEAIVEDLQKIFTAGREGAMTGMVQFIANKRLKTVLIIARQSSYLKQAQDWVRRYEVRAMGPEQRYYTYSLKNRQAKDVAEILSSMFGGDSAGPAAGNGSSVAPRFRESAQGGSIPNAALRPAADSFFGSNSLSGGLTGGGSPLFSGNDQSRQPQPSIASQSTDENAAEVVNSGQKNLLGQPRIRIVADNANNSLLIYASHPDYQKVLRVLETIDLTPNQVLIEATIAEVTLNDNLKFGVRWLFEQGQSSFGFSNAVDGAVGSVFPGFSYAMKSPKFTLNALNNVARVNVLSSPSLMVLDNRQATLQIGDQVPITTQTAIGTLTPNSPIINSVTYKDTGLILSITPKITDAGKVLLDIEQEVSSVSRTTSSNIDSPTIGRRRVRTTVMANDGESIALGGLIQEKKSSSSTHIPILGSIPIISNAFRDRNNLTEKTELIIVITPRVAKNSGEARAATQEYRDKIRALWRKSANPVNDVKRTARQFAR